MRRAAIQLSEHRPQPRERAVEESSTPEFAFDLVRDYQIMVFPVFRGVGFLDSGVVVL